MTAYPLPLDTEPMQAKAVTALPAGPGWQFEPKWDGFRCIAFKHAGEVALQARSGKSLSRYFPEMLDALRTSAPDQFVIDGELTIPCGDSLSFAALQDRLHPAPSRIRRLAGQTPSLLIAFDCLADTRGASLLALPLRERRAHLEHLIPQLPPTHVRLTPATCDPTEAQRWLDHSQGALDGVIAKRLDDIYQPGERAMLKVKHYRSADCVVGGFRYASKTRQVGSLLLGLYNADRKLDHVGFTSAIANADRAALTQTLEALRGEGFSGNAPGGSSRWSTERSTQWVPLRPELVVEVSYDHATGGRFRHGTALLRWRPDKAPGQCTIDQMQPELKPDALVHGISRHAQTTAGGQ